MTPSYTKEIFAGIAKKATGPDSMKRLLKEVGSEVGAVVTVAAMDKVPGSQFWLDVSNSVNKRVKKDEVEIGASHVAASFKEHGGTISAPGKGPGSRMAKYLTIPIGNMAKGKNVSDFKRKDTFVGKSKKGNLIIFLKEKTGKGWDKSVKALRSMMGPTPLFLLKKSTTHKPDPWWPEYDLVDNAIKRAGEEWFKGEVNNGL